MIKPNRHEAGRALGRKIETFDESVEAAKAFRGRGIDTVLLTLGAEGAISASPAGIWHARPPDVDMMSPVGSGDSFIAGYLSSLVMGLDTAAALKRGCAAGAATALTPGTELCHASDVQKLVDEVDLEQVE